MVKTVGMQTLHVPPARSCRPGRPRQPGVTRRCAAGWSEEMGGTMCLGGTSSSLGGELGIGDALGARRLDGEGGIGLKQRLASGHSE